MRHLKLVLVTVAVVVVANPATAQTCSAITVTSPEEPGAVTYHATVTADLQVAVAFAEPVSGDHLLELRFLQPSGRLYQEMAVPVADSASRVSAGGDRRKVPGYPYPVEVKVPVTTRESGEATVAVGFPVGGTQILASGLYGSWQVEALVDGTLCATTTFDLQAAPSVLPSELFADGFESGDDSAWSSTVP